jgi:hypothetical protein
MIYTVERKDYGIKLSFDGLLDEENAKLFINDFNKIIDSINGSVSILIDLRKGMPMPGKSQELVNEGYTKILQKGLTRSANIVSSSLMKMQMIRLAKEHGTYEKARYIDSTNNPDCENEALNWIEKGIDPDLIKPV